MSKPLGEWDPDRTIYECPKECVVCGATKGLVVLRELGFVSCLKHWSPTLSAMKDRIAEYMERKAKPKSAPRGGFEFL